MMQSEMHAINKTAMGTKFPHHGVKLK